MNANKPFFPIVLGCTIQLLCGFDKPSPPDRDFEKIKSKGPFDVIIVPGAPYGDSKMKIVLKSRILWAKYLYDRNVTKNIIFSGAAVYTPYVESKVMKIYADSLGLPSKHTFTETRAEHTTENIYFSVMMAKEMGFEKIAVATDPYQAVILNRFIKKNCPEVKMLVIDYGRIDLINAEWPTIDPTSAFQSDFVSLVVREDKTERMKGTFGKKIPQLENDSTYCGTQTPRSAGIHRLLDPLVEGSPLLTAFYSPAK